MSSIPPPNEYSGSEYSISLDITVYVEEEIVTTQPLTFEQKRDKALELFNEWADRFSGTFWSIDPRKVYFDNSLREPYAIAIKEAQSWDDLINIFEKNKDEIKGYEKFVNDEPLNILQELEAIINDFKEAYK